MIVSANFYFVSSAPSDISLGLAARIKQARDAANLSQVELAEQIGVSERTLQNWEAGTLPRPRHRRLVLAFIAEHEAVAA